MTQLSSELFEKFSFFIKQETGIYYGPQKKLLLSNRIKKRIKFLKLNDFSEYYNYLIGNKKNEMRKLFNVVTTNETHFFRHKDYFDLFKEIILSETSNKKNIFIWSAGCSSGDEPYSIAMILRESLDSSAIDNVKILATDISNYSLEKAKAGIYSYKAFSEIDKYYVNKYFYKIKINGRTYYEVNDNIKKMVDFQYLNLIKDVFPAKVDFIFCRNVLIYMEKQCQEKIVDKFFNSLRHGGYLFFGASELLLNNNKFVIRKHGRVRVYQKNIDF